MNNRTDIAGQLNIFVLLNFKLIAVAASQLEMFSDTLQLSHVFLFRLHCSKAKLGP